MDLDLENSGILRWLLSTSEQNVSLNWLSRGRVKTEF